MLAIHQLRRLSALTKLPGQSVAVALLSRHDAWMAGLQVCHVETVVLSPDFMQCGVLMPV